MGSTTQLIPRKSIHISIMKHSTVKPCSFYHKVLATTVEVKPRQDSRNLRARWKGGKIAVTVPATVSIQQTLDFVDRIAPVMLERKPESPYTIGHTIEFDEGSVIFTESAEISKICATCEKYALSGKFLITIAIPAETDITKPETGAAITKLLLSHTRRIAKHTLIAQAKAIAADIGRSPAAWALSSGHRVLGSCNIRGIIRLSHIIIFLPLHLRHYIICHELAHLSEMNHSERFHQIVNNYCNGREREFASELKRFRWPIIR